LQAERHNPERAGGGAALVAKLWGKKRKGNGFFIGLFDQCLTWGEKDFLEREKKKKKEKREKQKRSGPKKQKKKEGRDAVTTVDVPGHGAREGRVDSLGVVGQQKVGPSNCFGRRKERETRQEFRPVEEKTPQKKKASPRHLLTPQIPNRKGEKKYAA